MVRSQKSCAQISRDIVLCLWPAPTTILSLPQEPLRESWTDLAPLEDKGRPFFLSQYRRTLP